MESNSKTKRRVRLRWLFFTALLTFGLTVGATILLMNVRASEEPLEQMVDLPYGVKEEQFLRVMNNLLGPPFLPGNKITPLKNGDEIFPAMLAAINAAEKSITFETYIYWSGAIGKQFADALAQKARDGIPVHVLLDFFGSIPIEGEILTTLEESGVEIERYHPVKWYTLDKLNHRTHRKLLVVDGKVGFIGGVGIADEWLGDAANPDEWRDSHFQVEGPVVAQLQAAFTDNWLKTNATILHGEDYYPELKPAGDAVAQVFKSSPTEGSGSARLMFMLALAGARERIHLASAYFVPDALSIRHLIDAAERGVEVQIIVPGRHMNHEMVQHASRASWGPLLEAGIEIYEYDATMFHCKSLIIDEFFVSVGSANFDVRSFRLNDEANLNTFNADLAAKLTELFYEDLERADQVTLGQWEARPLREKAMERVGVLFESQM